MEQDYRAIPPVIESFEFVGATTGRTLVILGGVHGNEKCGTIALNRLKCALDSGALKIEAGRLLIVPVCNPGAGAAGVRFLDRNLNRMLYPKAENERVHYEDHIDSQLCAVLDQADYLLDLHSYTSGGQPFAFFEGEEREEKEFVAALGVTQSFVWHWAAAFQDSTAPPMQGQGTTEYARSVVNARAVTLECGQHDDATAPDVGYAGALRAMGHLGLLTREVAEAQVATLTRPDPGARRFVKMMSVIRNEPAKLCRDFTHLEILTKGEPLAERPDGTIISAQMDGYAVLPFAQAAAGQEMMYLAVEEEPF